MGGLPGLGEVLDPQTVDAVEPPVDEEIMKEKKAQRGKKEGAFDARWLKSTPLPANPMTSAVSLVRYEWKEYDKDIYRVYFHPDNGTNFTNGAPMNFYAKTTCQEAA
ncbi:MAG: hypothetical protein ACR2PL_02835 [Dehalococcoidia bacterium]